MANLSANQPGDVGIADPRPQADRGHHFDGVVRAGTLVSWNGLTGRIYAAEGDVALPKIHPGEFPSARVHISDFTYSPIAEGDRVKFVINRTSAGDKHALLVTKLG